MTVLTDTQVVTASGGLVELGYSQVTTGVTVNNGVAGTGVEVIAPLTVVCDGSPIMVEFFAAEARPYNAANYELNISLFEDSSEKIRSWGRQYNGVANFDNKPVHLMARLSPAAGSHTYSVRAYVTNTSPSTNTGRIEGGSGTTGTAPMFLRVSKIVTATQWPAVTTGTIIATSSTRPASPFAGTRIYETDTSRSWTYNGSQWIPDDMVFATEAARDVAITSPTEGMRAYITGSTVAAATGDTTAVPTGITTIYNGSVWVCTTPVGSRTDATGTTTSASYTATLSGSPGTNPSVTLVTGTSALVIASMDTSVSNAANFAGAAVAVSGAGTVAASDNWYIGSQSTTGITVSRSFVLTGLTAGTNTFTLNYKTNATGTYLRRNITVQGVA